MRVGILALLHESNTFISQPTTLAHFQDSLLVTGDEVRQRMAETHHEVGGFFQGLAKENLEAVPIFASRTVPYGAITAEAFASLLDTMFAALESAGQLDGILVGPHGATVSEEFPDADGHWLAELRKRVGDDLPLIGTLDAHANLSPLMIESTDALVAYRSNPHLDQRLRGVEAATLMARTLRGEIKPTQAATFPPLAINIERQLTTDPHLTPLYGLADEILERKGVVSNSILLGFPYSDVEEMGSSAIVVTDNNPALATELASELGEYMWTHRDDFAGQMISIDEALDQAEQLDGRVCLLDMGDNVGGGSPADSTHLTHAMKQRGIENAFICLYDPPAVQQAAEAGVGSSVRLSIGGRTDTLHGEPFPGDFTVLGLYDGQFVEPQPRHGGIKHGDQGPTAVVRDGELTVMLTSKRMAPFSLQQLISCGLDPESFRVLVAKGVNLPVASYGPICPHMIRVNTPGCTTADMTMLDFQHRRRPMFPFETDVSWAPQP